MYYITEIYASYTTAAVKLGGYPVRIPAWLPTILTDGLRGFPQTLQANAGVVL